MLFGPQEGLEWDYNTEGVETKWKLYLQAILVGMYQVIPKPVKCDKLRFISQGSDENPATFQLQLEETFQRHTNVCLCCV